MQTTCMVKRASMQVDGPAFTSRALAIIHLAMWDAYVGISQDAGTYCDYDSLPDVDEGVTTASHFPH